MREKIKKRMITAIMMVLLAVLFVQPAEAKAVNAKKYSLTDVRKARKLRGEWIRKPSGVQFRTIRGNKVKNLWIQTGGSIYYMDSKGYRAKGWVNYRDDRYYMDSSGKLHTGWLTLKDNVYYFRKDGTMAKGLRRIQGKKYYFSAATGIRKTGWVKIGKYQYFFHWKTGAMQTSRWVRKGRGYCYVGANGRKQTSRWLTLDGKRYYVDENGMRVTGKVYLGNKGYYFRKNGVYDASVKVKPEVDASKPMVALTFDDGPSPHTARLLNCLEKYGAKATFFMVGYSVPNYKGTVKRMAKLGCELGSHSYDHPAFSKLSYSGIRSQVTRTNQVIHEAAGAYPTVFRLPYGDGASNASVLSALGLPSICWSLDTRDWANTGNPQHTVNEVLNNVKDGDIVLMHDLHSSTVTAAETIIPALKKRGFQMVTVSQLAKYRGKTTLKSGKSYYNFRK